MIALASDIPLRDKIKLYFEYRRFHEVEFLSLLAFLICMLLFFLLDKDACRNAMDKTEISQIFKTKIVLTI